MPLDIGMGVETSAKFCMGVQTCVLSVHMCLDGQMWPDMCQVSGHVWISADCPHQCPGVQVSGHKSTSLLSTWFSGHSLSIWMHVLLSRLAFRCVQTSAKCQDKCLDKETSVQTLSPASLVRCRALLEQHYLDQRPATWAVPTCLSFFSDLLPTSIAHLSHLPSGLTVHQPNYWSIPVPFQPFLPPGLCSPTSGAAPSSHLPSPLPAW